MQGWICLPSLQDGRTSLKQLPLTRPARNETGQQTASVEQHEPSPADIWIAYKRRVARACSFTFHSLYAQMDLQSTHKMLEDLKLSRRLKEFLKRGLTLGIFALCAIMLRITVTNGGPDQKVFNRYNQI